MGLLADLRAVDEMTAKTVFDSFGVKIGLSFNDVITKLDQPLIQKQKKTKLVCKWKKRLDNNREIKFSVIFVDGVVVKVK